MSKTATKETVYYKGVEGHRLVGVAGDDSPPTHKSDDAKGFKERWVCECGSTGTFGTKTWAELKRDHTAHVEREGK